MKLSEFEIDVMNCFWASERLSAPEVHEQITAAGDRDVTYSTVKTIIDRLEAKEALERVANVGRTIFYSSIVDQNSVRQPLIDQLVNRLFAGKSRPLLAYLMEDDSLSESDIEYLKSILDKRS